VQVTTDWYFDKTAHWARLKLDPETSQATVKFMRSFDTIETCAVSIVTGKKAQLNGNCGL
jgi:hypothetical protein